MEHTLKKSLITVFKKFIQHLENGYCDNLSDEQYNEMLKAFLVLNKIEKEINDGGNNTISSRTWWAKCLNRFNSVL